MYHIKTSLLLIELFVLNVYAVEIPSEWIKKYEDGRYIISTGANPLDGLFPSFSNGFLAGDYGCSNDTNPDTKGGSCGRVNLAGVFNNETYYDDDNAGTFPRRASISNPYSVYIDNQQSISNTNADTEITSQYIASALDLKLGKIYNRSLVSCGNNNEETYEIETSIWASRNDRNVLIFEIKAYNLTNQSCLNQDGISQGQIFVPLSSCSIGEDGTSEAFNFINTLNSDEVEVWELEVREMEMPPVGSSMPSPENTKASIAFQPLPFTTKTDVDERTDDDDLGLIISFDQPVQRYHAVFHSSIEMNYKSSYIWSNEELDESKHGRKDLGLVTLEGLESFNHLQHFIQPSKHKDSNNENKESGDNLYWIKSDEQHEKAWDDIWLGGIEVEGNNTLALAINASLYNLVSALRVDFPLGISPGGLTHDAYEGHSFWDAETWMFPNLVALFPLLSETLMEYRVSRLEAAQDTARLQGFTCADPSSSMVPCAVWPWESALLGFGVSPWLEADAYEIHVAGDISMALQLAFRASGNDVCFFYDEMDDQSAGSSYVLNHRWDVISACASFYVEKAIDIGNYTWYNVIGPDENAGVVNSSVYTNAIASKSMLWANEAADYINNQDSNQVSNQDESVVTVDPSWTVIGSKPYMPLNILPNSELEGHPEYDGYYGQDINQVKDMYHFISKKNYININAVVFSFLFMY